MHFSLALCSPVYIIQVSRGMTSLTTINSRTDMDSKTAKKIINSLYPDTFDKEALATSKREMYERIDARRASDRRAKRRQQSSPLPSSCTLNHIRDIYHRSDLIIVAQEELAAARRLGDAEAIAEAERLLEAEWREMRGTMRRINGIYGHDIDPSDDY